MLFTFGLLILFVGGTLLAISAPKLLFARRSGAVFNSVKLVFSSLGLIALSIYMIHEGRESEPSISVPIGIGVFFTGLIIMALGVWIGLWGPASLRNTNKGLQFIIIGLTLLIAGIAVMTLCHGDGLSSLSCHHWNLDHWRMGNIFQRRIGPFSYGLFAFFALVLANGLALRNDLSFKKILGVNGVTLALLTLLYALSPTLFPHCYWY